MSYQTSLIIDDERIFEIKQQQYEKEVCEAQDLKINRWNLKLQQLVQQMNRDFQHDNDIFQEIENEFIYPDIIFAEDKDRQIEVKSAEDENKLQSNSSSQVTSIFNCSNILNNSSASNTNFLKNLITLVRTWVKTELMPSSIQPSTLILWQSFLKTKKNSKNILNLIYGSSEQSETHFKKLCHELKIASLENISYRQILFSQEQLRAQTRRQLINANVQFIIKNRRIQNKQEFQLFLSKFLTGLQSGKMDLKVSKKAKKQ